MYENKIRKVQEKKNRQTLCPKTSSLHANDNIMIEFFICYYDLWWRMLHKLSDRQIGWTVFVNTIELPAFVSCWLSTWSHQNWLCPRPLIYRLVSTIFRLSFFISIFSFVFIHFRQIILCANSWWIDQVKFGVSLMARENVIPLLTHPLIAEFYFWILWI